MVGVAVFATAGDVIAAAPAAVVTAVDAVTAVAGDVAVGDAMP